MKTRILAGAIVAAVLVSAGLASFAAAQGVGAIGGNVSDGSGAALPGVTVSLSNPGVIGGDQSTVTDERGAYQFTRLVPGNNYAVKTALQGFRSAVQERIVVNSDTTTRVDLHLEIGAVEESITVSSQSPLLDTTQTLKQTVMTRETLDVLPSRSDVWAIARMAPAVVMNKYDVGGSEMFSQSFAQIYGSTDNERAYTIDGMDVTWAGGEGFVISYLDAHMFDEVNLQTASGSAESPKGGLITNMVSKTGSNRLLGSYSFSGGGENTSWDNLSGQTLADLLAAVPLRARIANPDLVPSAKTLGIFDNSGTVSGPILRDRLWFSVTGSIATLAQYRVGSYNLDGSRAKDENLMRNISSKVSWQARRNSQLHFLYNFNNKGQFNRTENTGPITDFIDGNATIHQTINSNIVQTRWTSVLRNNLLFDASGSYLHGDEHGRPQDAVELGSIPTFDLVRREHTVAPPNFLHRPATRVNVLSSLTFHAGSHDLKAGYQFMYRKASDTWTGVISPYAPSGFRRQLSNGLPNSVNTYNSPTTFVMYSNDHAGYIQDRWTPTRKLTLNLGLRLESTYAWEPALCQEQTLFIAAQCFSKIEGVPDLVGLSPRFGAIYDVAGDGKTAIKLTINRYNQPIGVNYMQTVNPVRLVNDTRQWTDNGDFVPQLDELGPSTGFNLGTTNRFADDLKWPYAVEYSIGVQRSLPYEMVAGVTYINRQRGSEIGSRNLLVPTDTYIPKTVTEVNSGATVTVYDQDPSLRGKFDVLYGNYPEMDTDFNGVDITLNKRLSHRWMMMGSASFGESLGDIYGSTFDLNDPNNSFRRGLIGNDVPFSLKIFGLYQLPYGIQFSGTVQHFTGFPELTTVSVSSTTVPTLTRVTQRVTYEPRGTTRLPDVNLVDISLRKTWTNGRYTVEPIMDMFNVGNVSTIRARSTQLGPSYGVASDVVRGRIIKFGLNVRF